MISMLFLLGCLYIWHFGVSLHEVCPAVAVCAGPICLENQQLYFTNGLIFFAVIVITSLMFTRYFCGWVCPVGLFQKILYSIRNKITKKKVVISHKLHLTLVFFKYLLTIVILIGIFYTNKMLTVDYCPVYLFAGWNKIPAALPAVILLTIIIIVTLFIRRFFCRYLCPLSVFFEISIWLGHKLKISRTMKRNVEHCTNCKVCEIQCPVGIKMTEHETNDTIFCIACGACMQHCPKNKKNIKTLYIK